MVGSKKKSELREREGEYRLMGKCHGDACMDGGVASHGKTIIHVSLVVMKFINQ